MKIQPLLGLALACACPSFAHAAAVTFGFTGSVAYVPADDPGGGIGSGTPFSGQYVFDTAAPDGIADGAQGSYSSFGPSFGLSVQIGANSYDLAGFLNIGVSNDVVGRDQYMVLADDFAGWSVSMMLEDITATALASDALPTLPPLLGAFAVRDFQLYDTTVGDVQIVGMVDSLTCVAGCGTPIPEPATLALLGAGLAAGALRRRAFA